MIQKTRQKGHIEIVFPIVLFLVFTLSALVIILYAARTYQHIVEDSQTQYDDSVSLAYLSQKIHAGDSASYVSIQQLEGMDALSIRQDIEGLPYVTYIYVYDGYLRELFIADNGQPISPAAGMPLFEVRSFSATYIDDNLLMLKLVHNNSQEATQLVTIRSEDRQEVMR